MIKLENVTKTYKGDVPALRDADVNIDKGEFVFLVGASGSGKSTFLRLVNREERPESGRIFVAGKDILDLSSWKVPYLRRNIGSVFQDFKLLSNKTVYENVAFALEVIGRPKHVIQSQVPAILELVGLSKKVKSFPHELSGGEQQRVSVARAFVNRPLILLADEPTGNLDPATAARVMDLLQAQVSEAGLAVGIVRSTSDLAETEWAEDWGAIVEIDDRNGGHLRMPGLPWRFGASELNTPGIPSFQGEDNAEILKAAGLTAGAIQDLKKRGVIMSRRSPAGPYDTD